MIIDLNKIYYISIEFFMFKVLLFCCFLSIFASVDNSLMSNIQKLFSEKIEIFSAVEFSKVSVLTGIVKISLKVKNFFFISIHNA